MNSQFELLIYLPGESRSEKLLERYLRETPVENNRTRKQLRLDLYNGSDGVLFFLVNKAFEQVVGVTSCVRYSENGVVSAKTWHRMHLNNEVPKSAIDRFFEPATFSWCRQLGINRLWVTFNESNPRTAAWAAARMGERRNAARPNAFTSGTCHEIRSNWQPLNRLVFERNVWQYVIFYSPDTNFFLQRMEKPLDAYMTSIFKKNFPTVTKHWPRVVS